MDCLMLNWVVISDIYELKLYGSELANLLGIGGGHTCESITAAFEIILEDKKCRRNISEYFWRNNSM